MLFSPREVHGLRKKFRSDMPPVVVTGAFQTGVVLMRGFARRQIEVCCVDCDPGQEGFKTIYGKAFCCPNPDTHPEAWERFMIELAGKLGRKPVLISSADQFVTAIADHAAALEPHFIFRAASMVVQGLLATKKRQYEIADQHGLPVPKTKLVHSLEEVREFGRESHFPCLLKPIHFRDWEREGELQNPLYGKKIAVVHTADELEATYCQVEQFTPDLIAQEIIEGPDDAKLVYLSCYGRGSRRLGSCIVRELRTEPMNFGSASLVEPIEDPETDALCDHFLRSVGYEGLCELEVKRDVRDGRVMLIEANPRYSITSDAAPYAGVDLGWLHYLDLIGENVEPVKWNGRHFHHIVLRRDVKCFRSYLQAGLSWKAFIQSYRSAVFFDFEVRDWRIAINTIVYLTRVLGRPVFRRVFRRRGQARPEQPADSLAGNALAGGPLSPRVAVTPCDPPPAARR